MLLTRIALLRDGLLTVTLCLFSFCAIAESSSSDTRIRVEQVTVTGTRVNEQPAGGLVTIDRADIANSGATTLSALFRDLVFAAAGTIDEQFTQGFAPASAAANLRGLGVSRTLVLLDGRRLPVFPFAQEGSQSFVDLNLIPLGSVERIEVLKDGASSIYGADAVAGVVNIITRRAESGAEVSARVSQSSEGDGEEAWISAHAGFTAGDAEIGLGLDYMDREPIWARDRPLSRTANGPVDARSSAGNPGTFITSLGPVPDPACPAASLSGPFCLYDFAPDVTLIPGAERLGLSASMDYAITPSIGLFARIHYTDTESERDLAAAPNGYPIAPTNPNNPFGEPVLAIYRLTELGPRRDRFTSEAYNAVTGLAGVWGTWQWESAVSISQTDTAIDGINGYAVAADVQAAIDAGTLNVFGDSPTFDPAAVSYTTQRTGESDLLQFDARMQGTLFEWRGGAVNAAFGAEWRREDFNETFDPRTANGEIIGVGGVSADGDRDVWAAFAEFGLPLIENVDLTLSVRYDHYSDFGGTLNPAASMTWRTSDTLSVHARVGTGFKAPALHELYAGDIFAFASVFDTTNCNAAQTANDPAGIAQYCDGVQQVASIASGNEDLDAEESDHASLGARWEPNEHVSLQVDLWQIDNTDAVVSSAQFYVDNEARFAGNVIRNGTGDLATVLSPFQNVAAQEMWGTDLTGNAHMKVGDGAVHARLTASLLGSFEQSPSPGEPAVALEGKDGYPEWRAQLSLDWTLDRFATGLTLNHIDGYERVAGNDSVDAWSTVNVHATWSPRRLRGSEIRVGIEDALDAEPPEDPFLQGWPFFNRALHNPRGRFFFARYTHRLN